MKIAIAGTGYVGLSLAVLLAQHNEVVAVDVIMEKVEKINKRISPIQDKEIEEYLSSKELNLVATTDGVKAYKDADFVVIAAPTNYDPQKNFFDCSAVEAVIQLVLDSSSSAIMVIKSTVPVGYTKSVRRKFNTDRIIFSPEFLRESKALYDNLYPSRIIIGCDEGTRKAAEQFASMLQEGALKKNIDTLFMGFTEAEAVKLFANTYGSIIFLVGLAMPHYRLLIPSASLDMNLRQCFRVITPTATNSGTACFLTPRRTQAS